ncbi:RNA-directed DNA polymerase [Brachionus plicatilis]|uniref:RNA-directed DNA polymerase n=1 Tax=Brachionus plicatilis TaxID=10195 RepID=A0A3M7QE52_BRAPC|nr:RNA-directed DNA polymerase [Brachionus plicatilis]
MSILASVILAAPATSVPSERLFSHAGKAYQVKSNNKEEIKDVKSGGGKCPRIKISVLGSSFDVGVDTQASVNALSRKTYEKMAIGPDQETNDTLVYSFDGNVPLKSMGKFKKLIFANKRSVEAEFIVFDRVRDNLLSYKTSLDLELTKAYRNTPHSSSKVAASSLIFIKSNSSKLPATVEDGNFGLKIDGLIGLAKHSDEKVLYNTSHNKRLINKYKPRFSEEVWTVNEIKGSMMTVVKSDGKTLTRNVSLFKKAPNSMEEELEFDVVPEISKPLESANDVNLRQTQNEQVMGQQTRRVSIRSVKPVDRFIACRQDN